MEENNVATGNEKKQLLYNSCAFLCLSHFPICCSLNHEQRHASRVPTKRHRATIGQKEYLNLLVFQEPCLDLFQTKDAASF